MSTRRAGRAVEIVRFLIDRKFKGFDIPDSPHMEAAGVAYLLQKLHTSRSYLEYGGGGSTVIAARLGLPFISVDNDRIFLESVRSKIGSLNIDQILLHVDTGLTVEWGYPLFKGNTLCRMKAWRRYAHAPWERIRQSERFPDLVFIDGRFRVACALVSILNLQSRAESEVEILVDDYTGREQYRAIEDFADLTKTIGRLAVFRLKTVDIKALHSAVAEYGLDYR